MKGKRQVILDAAIKMAKITSYHSLTRAGVALCADCAPSLVSHYFKTTRQLKRAVVREALTRGDSIIIAQGLASNDPYVKRYVTPNQREAAALALR